MLAEHRCAMSEAARRLGQIHRCRRQRRGPRQAGIVGVAEQARRADVRVLDRLLRWLERASRDLGLLQLGERFVRGALSHHWAIRFEMTSP